MEISVVNVGRIEQKHDLVNFCGALLLVSKHIRNFTLLRYLSMESNNPIYVVNIDINKSGVNGYAYDV